MSGNIFLSTNGLSRSTADAVLLFVAAFTAMFLLMDRSLNVYDEGLILTGSMLVHSGEVIHRDFYANYGPAVFYILSWLYDLFGQYAIVERLVDLACRAAILVEVYLICVSAANRRAAMFAAFVCFLWFATIGNYGYPVFPGLLCALVSTHLIVQAIVEGASVWKFFLAGTLAAGATLFRYDIGAALFVVHALYACGTLLGEGERPSFSRSVRNKKSWAYLVGFAIPLACLAMFYVREGVLGDLVYDVVLFPAKYYAPMRGLPFPGLGGAGVLDGLSRLAIYLPIAINGAIFADWFAATRASVSSHRELDKQQSNVTALSARWVGVLVLMSCLFYLKGVVRVSVLHIQLGLVPSILALSIHATATRRQHGFRWWLTGLLVLTILSASSYALRHLTKTYRVGADLSWFLGFARGMEGFVVEKTPADRRSAVLLRPLIGGDAAREAAMDFLARHLGQDERIFVGLTRHDKVFINDVSAYFMLRHLPATKWHHFDPGLQTSRTIQAGMVSDLERTRPSYIWLESTWEDHREPNQSAIGSGVHVLHAYLRAHYVPAQSFGAIMILRRR